MMIGDYCELPILNAGGVALVDRADSPRLNQFKWYWHGCVRRTYKIAGRSNTRTLAHEILGLERREFVTFINGDRLAHRRANLRERIGFVYVHRKSKRNPFRVQISIADVMFDAGGYPTRETAEAVREKIGTLARELRAQKLTQRQIKRQLDLATGRAKLYGAELSELIRAALPPVLPLEVRQEAEQEIALAVLDGRLTPEQLTQPGALRECLRAASRLCVSRYRGKHVSLDHMIAGGRRLVDVLAG
jgi:hypothetical protein